MTTKISKSITRLHWPLLLGFPIFALISTAWSLHPWDSIGAGAVLLLVAITIGLLSLFSQQLLSAVVKFGSAFMVFLVLAFFFATLLFAVDSGSGRFAAPFFEGPGPGGATVTLATLGAFAAAKMIWKRQQFLILPLVGFMGAMTVAFSGTRLAAVALIAGTLAFLLLERTILRLWTSLSVAVGLGLGSLAPVTMVFLRPRETSSVEGGRFTTRILGDAGNDFSSGRLEIWSNKVAEMPDAVVFGIGFDNSQKVGGLMAHNQFLTVTEEVGIVGLVLFVGFLVAVFNYLSPGLSRNPYLPALIGSATLLMGDSFLFGWRNPNSMMTWLVLLLALGYSVSNTKSRQLELTNTTARSGKASG